MAAKSAREGGQLCILYHYTDEAGYKAISANSPWKFEAKLPRRPGNPVGAYFTTLPPGTKNLAERIGVSREKTRFVFAIIDANDLVPLNPDRSARFQVKFYSRSDYYVPKDRQYQPATGENPAWT